MDRKIVRRLFRGLGANIYGQAIAVVIQLAGVPILLYHWGPQLYGEWLILFAIPSYLSMTDLGFSQSAGNEMTGLVARGDRVGAITTFQSLGALVSLLVGTGLVFVTGAAMLLPLGNWMHFANLGTPDVRWILWLLAAEVLVKLIEGVSHAGLRANGDYPLGASIYSTTLFAQHATVWLLASLGSKPVTAAAAFFAIRAIVTPSVTVLLMRRHPWLQFGFSAAHVARLRTLVRPALANTGLPLAQALNVQGMLLLVGAMLGPIAVVTFSTLRTLTRFALQLVTTIGNASEPELASAFGKGDYGLLRSLYQHVLRGGVWFSVTASIGLALTGGWILESWTHGKVNMDLALFRWLIASAVAGALWYGSLTLLKAANRHLRAAIVFIGSAAGALVLAAVLVKGTGSLASAGASLLIMDAAMAIYTLRAAARLCGSSALEGLYSALNPAPLIRLLAARSHAY